MYSIITTNDRHVDTVTINVKHIQWLPFGWMAVTTTNVRYVYMAATCPQAWSPLMSDEEHGCQMRRHYDMRVWSSDCRSNASRHGWVYTPQSGASRGRTSLRHNLAITNSRSNSTAREPHSKGRPGTHPPRAGTQSHARAARGQRTIPGSNTGDGRARAVVGGAPMHPRGAGTHPAATHHPPPQVQSGWGYT